jgi:uncharacterized protein (TIGR00251 family)
MKHPPPLSSSSSWPCLSEASGGVILRVSVVPNAKTTQAVGLHDGALRVRLAAPPIEGRANEALCHWVAAELGLPKRDVRLRRGTSSRAKQLEVDAPCAEVLAWLGRCQAAWPDWDR